MPIKHQPVARTATRRHPWASHTARMNSPKAITGSTSAKPLIDFTMFCAVFSWEERRITMLRAAQRRQRHPQLLLNGASTGRAGGALKSWLHARQLFLQAELGSELHEQRVQVEHDDAVRG
jgi:hypothetical protein